MSTVLGQKGCSEIFNEDPSLVARRSEREKEADELPRWVSFTMRKIEMGRVRILNR